MENSENRQIKLKMTKLDEGSERLKRYRYVLNRIARGPEILEVPSVNKVLRTPFFCTSVTLKRSDIRKKSTK